MNDRRLRLVMAALALATTAIAAYLVRVHYSGGAVVCASGGCETVQHSRYSAIFGVPVALIGLLGSAAILASLLRTGTVERAAGLFLTVFGLVFAVYLVVLQVAVIGAVCEWCVVNDALLAVLALLAAWRVAASGALRAP